jgi:hypothetical protein
MGQETYKIPRVTDEQIHQFFVDMANDFGSFTVDVHVGHESIGSIAYPKGSQQGNARQQEEAEARQNKMEHVLTLKSELITRFAGNVNGVFLNYFRGGVPKEGGAKSPVFDDLIIDPQTFDADRLSIAARTIALFRPVQLPSPSDPITLLETQRALQESSFSRLQLQLEKVFEQTINLRSQLDEQVRGKEAALEQEFKQKEFEAAQQLERREKALASKESDLDEKRKSLDESDNTFARRQIRDRMLSDVAARVQNFGLSETTVNARRPVAIGMFFLCIFLLILLSFTWKELNDVRANSAKAAWFKSTPAIPNNASEIASAAQLAARPQSNALGFTAATEVNTTERILLWIRFALLSIGLAASILYYIRWQNTWATTFATTEQNLQQFHIDVNRANWVVETCLEWRKETKSDLPAPLIESLTRGLFAGRETPTTVLHPADELASALMGSASKLSLDINGNKLDIDKPGKIPKEVKTGG